MSLAPLTKVDIIERPIANFKPNIWGDFFLKYHSQEIHENMEKQVQIEKEEVKKIFQSSSNNISQQLNFIDSLQRLGISYHFESEIDEALEQIHNTLTNNKLITQEGDLHFLALAFRLLRQKEHHISSDIFKKFKKNNRNFNENVCRDVKGMWSFYEATHLRIHGENILDEALDFTYSHLKLLNTNQLSPFLATQIPQCLRTPFHKGVPRLESRCYISSYGKEPSHNKILLNFAKLDFNLVQKIHQQEIGSLTMSWKKSEFDIKIPYARDRVVEAYFWPLTISYEPKYSSARKIGSRVITCITILDDTYDAFATIEELEIFTHALQRWDISLIESLPECMEVVFKTILELWDEIETTIGDKGKSSLVLEYAKQSFYKLALSYFIESKWCNEGYIPTYYEYKANGIISSTFRLILVCFIGLSEFSNKELLDWIFSDDQIIIDIASKMARLKDDVSSHKFEQERVHVASAVECCMKQYDMSMEDAYKLILKEVEDYWIIMNEECLKLKNIPKPVLEFILNFGRVTEFTFENLEDRYSNGELLKDDIVTLLIDPISIEQSEL